VSVARPTFFYDLYSPYAYLAAVRLDDVLPVPPSWQPIAFGVVLREARKTPWSLRDGEREAGQRESSRRARERGLGELRWPSGWPAESYSLQPLRAVLGAAQQDPAAGKELALALYRLVFGEGIPLNDSGIIVAAAAACALDGEALRSAAQRQPVKDALRASTADAVARGVTGIPTVAVGEELYWGDDRLEEAAAALAG
jgi:2-hydroxychromene-2-carboxylate isomerase